MLFFLIFVTLILKRKGKAMRILFCTDGSECSFSAFKNAAAFINKAVVDIICVVDWNFLPSSMNIDGGNYTHLYDNIADSVLNFAQKIVEGENFEVNQKIKLIGSASEGILETLSQYDYDLVVMGSQGKKGIQKWLGSVSRVVVENTTVPCFISKKKTNAKKVLFTTDGLEASYDAAKKFLNVFDFKDKDVTILNVKDNPEYFPIDIAMDKNWADAIDKQQKILASKAVNKMKMIMEEANIPINNEVILTGNPAQEIIDYCEENDIDLVVMGARSKKDLSKIFLGSVSYRVLDSVNCGVLIVSKVKNK